jgi:hypothetical protein
MLSNAARIAWLVVLVSQVSYLAIAQAQNGEREHKRDMSIQHVEKIPVIDIPTTGTTNDGTKYGFVRIPKEGPVIQERGNATIIDNDPADYGVGVTVPLE